VEEKRSKAACDKTRADAGKSPGENGTKWRGRIYECRLGNGGSQRQGWQPTHVRQKLIHGSTSHKLAYRPVNNKCAKQDAQYNRKRTLASHYKCKRSCNAASNGGGGGA